MKKPLFAPILVALALAPVACDDDPAVVLEGFAATLDGTGVVHEVFTASALSGDNEVPAVTTTATGDATFTAVGTSLSYTVNVAGIDDATASHIHSGAAGANGGVIVSLFGGPATGAGFSGVLAEGSVDVDESVLTEMRSGDTYVNVHTTLNGPGELRDQVALVTTAATGAATFTVDGLTLSFTLNLSNIDEVTAAHIHSGAAGATGGVIVPLFAGPTTAPGFSGLLVDATATVTEEILTELRSGNTYVNVHTVGNPMGEIRGQVTLN